MSAETVIVTAVTIAVRALIDGIAALREGAKADERAEIDRLLAKLHASAPQPVASSLDATTEAHLARVRAWRAERLAEQAAKDAIADRPIGCAGCGIAVALVGDPLPLPGTLCQRCYRATHLVDESDPTPENK